MDDLAAKSVANQHWPYIHHERHGMVAVSMQPTLMPTQRSNVEQLIYLQATIGTMHSVNTMHLHQVAKSAMAAF